MVNHVKKGSTLKELSPWLLLPGTVKLLEGQLLALVWSFDKGGWFGMMMRSLL